MLTDESYTLALGRLVEDRIVDVRIGLARLVGGLCRQTTTSPLLPPPTSASSAPAPTHVRRLAERLQKDESREVRSFVPEWSFAPLHPDSTTDSDSKAGLAPPVTPAPSTSDSKTPAATPDAKAQARPALMKKTSSLSGDGFVFATFSKPPPAPPFPVPVQESEEGGVEDKVDVDRLSATATVPTAVAVRDR